MTTTAERSTFGANSRDAVEREGFFIVARAARDETVATLARALDDVRRAAPGVLRRGGVYAIRNLLDVVPAAREFARSDEARALVEPVLGPNYVAVRGTLFDKTPEARWKVAWHQDLSIAVRRRVEVDGFSLWSEKAGVVHVQPPAGILERMLALRLHLDACDESNGALKVVPGSHLWGRLTPEEIVRRVGASSPVTCAVPRGGALLMRPLLLHSSPTPRASGHRRVIHLEFAPDVLPGGLEWRA